MGGLRATCSESDIRAPAPLVCAPISGSIGAARMGRTPAVAIIEARTTSMLSLAGAGAVGQASYDPCEPV